MGSSGITTKVPEPYASRLVFDQNLGQEVISGDSQLSKEIIVDSGTKIDSFRDPRSQEDLGVFVKGTTLREKWSAPPGQWSLPPEQPWSSFSSASSPPASSASTLQGEASDPRHRLPCPTGSLCTVGGAQ